MRVAFDNSGCYVFRHKLGSSASEGTTDLLAAPGRYTATPQDRVLSESLVLPVSRTMPVRRLNVSHFLGRPAALWMMAWAGRGGALLVNTDVRPVSRPP